MATRARPRNSITDASGILLAQAEDRDSVSGTTVVLAEAPAVASFDDLVGESEDCLRDRQAERLRGLQVNHQVKPCRLLASRRSIASPVGLARASLAPEDRKISRFGSRHHLDEQPAAWRYIEVWRGP